MSFLLLIKIIDCNECKYFSSEPAVVNISIRLRYAPNSFFLLLGCTVISSSSSSCFLIIRGRGPLKRPATNPTERLDDTCLRDDSNVPDADCRVVALRGCRDLNDGPFTFHILLFSFPPWSLTIPCILVGFNCCVINHLDGFSICACLN
jgi:hypothetical protein